MIENLTELQWPGYEWVILTRTRPEGGLIELRLAVFHKPTGTYAYFTQERYNALVRDGYDGLDQIPEACLLGVTR